MIALCIIAYLVFGFLLSMVGTFLFKRANDWDDGWKIFYGIMYNIMATTHNFLYNFRNICWPISFL